MQHSLARRAVAARDASEERHRDVSSALDWSLVLFHIQSTPARSGSGLIQLSLSGSVMTSRRRYYSAAYRIANDEAPCSVVAPRRRQQERRPQLKRTTLYRSASDALSSVRADNRRPTAPRVLLATSINRRASAIATRPC